MGIFLNSIFFIIFLPIIIINQFLLHSPVAAKYILSTGDELTNLHPSSFLVSAGGNFTLDFFTIKSTNLTYIGIQYTYDGRIVWVANRDNPIVGDGALIIDEAGTLKVISRGGSGTNTTVFNVSNQVVGSGINTTAVLEDSGNFVLYDNATKNRRILWQSFDYPTDTLLPGMKLGYNLTTGQNWTLTSWLTDHIPASGAYTLRLEQIQNSTQLVIYRRGKVYWSSGYWRNGRNSFKFFTQFVNGILVSDASGIYFAVQSLQTDSINVISMLQLPSMGGIIDERYNFVTPTFCYGYQSHDGCAISALPNCRDQSHIVQLVSRKWEGYLIQSIDSSNISLSDCMEICWNDCNCQRFSTISVNGTGCFTWGRSDAYAGVISQAGAYAGVNGQLQTGGEITQKVKGVLNQGDELDITSTIISADGSFTMGFFTSSSSNFTYLGIWYTDDNNRKVWVANRDIPMMSSGVLVIDKSGTLKVIREGGSNTTLFNIYNHVNSGDTKAVLKDSGNFVLYDAEGLILWQSFDHPTDTLLLGMKLGYNLTTKQNWTLTSWFSDQIPASGAFTLRLERIQSSIQLVIYRRGKVYWTSGSWIDGRNGFEFLDLYNSFVGNGILVSDSSGMYFAIQTKGTTTMLQLSSLGEVIDRQNNLVTPSLCYGIQSDDGCAVSTLPNCRGQNDRFQLDRGIRINLIDLIQYDDSSSISLSDCMERCWNDCKCKGFSTNSNGTGCYTWVGDAGFLPDLWQPILCGVLVSQKPPKKKTWIWGLISVAIVLTSALTTCFCGMKIRRRMLKEQENRKRDKYIHQLTGSASFNYGDELEKGIKDAPNVKIFSLRAILTATNNFSNENKLGQGGYGPVYKGKLTDGRQIAVKRLSKTSRQGIQEFKSELILISKLQHTNLVRLYGCCIHQEEKMLIYEFMSNKSLDFFLFAEDKKKTIDWRMRYNIIEGVAQGLLYLHKYSRMRVIHRDLKVSNILLDENMNPKIADFGMAKMFQQNATEAITNRVVGTYGYMAPEYAMGGTFSVKSDVFSFGVLILEIVSGKRNSSFYNIDRALNLVGYAWEQWKGETPLKLKDESLGESCDIKQLLRTIHVGLLCVQENADDRPTMREVISKLKNETADLPCPKQPAFLTGTQLIEAETKPNKNTPTSMNGLTITMMEAR